MGRWRWLGSGEVKDATIYDATVNVQNCLITAPVTGRIGLRLVEEGKSCMDVPVGLYVGLYVPPALRKIGSDLGPVDMPLSCTVNKRSSLTIQCSRPVLVLLGESK